jgi:nucleoid-associated protein YgaU
VDDQTTQKPAPRKAAPPAGDAPPAPKDLSSEIEQAVEREPADQVRCVHVFGNYYRCNWWSRPTGSRATPDYAWGGLFSDFIRKSSFLAATTESGQLVIKEVKPLVPERV